jgi:hypothetical protein
MELIENSDFRLFATNGKWKWQTYVCLLKTETENGSLLFLVGKRYMVIDDCCFSKHAHLCRLCMTKAVQYSYTFSYKTHSSHTLFLSLFSFLLHMVHLFTFFTPLAFLSLDFSFTFPIFLSSSYSCFILCS